MASAGTRLVLCFIMAAAVFGSCAAQRGCQEPEHGLIRKGSTYNDPSDLITDSARECGCRCGEDPRCQTWTRDRRTGACAFKDRVVEPRSNPHFDSGVVGGERLDPNIPVDDSCIVEFGVDFKGEDYQEIHTDSAQGCCRACENDRKCASWTRIRRNGRCFLKSGVPQRLGDRRTDGGTAF